VLFEAAIHDYRDTHSDDVAVTYDVTDGSRYAIAAHSALITERLFGTAGTGSQQHRSASCLCNAHMRSVGRDVQL